METKPSEAIGTNNFSTNEGVTRKLRIINFAAQPKTGSYQEYLLFYRQLVAKAFALVGLPLTLLLGVFDYIQGKLPEAIVATLIFINLLILFLITFRYLKTERLNSYYNVFFRTFIVLFAIYLLYVSGMEARFSRIPWYFVFPIFAFFSLERNEGMFWVTLLLIALVWVLFRTDFQITEGSIQALKMRFLILFGLISVFCHLLSFVFRSTIQGLFERNNKLEESEANYREAYKKLETGSQERRQAEEALKASEERYRTLVENTMDGYFICEVSSGRFIFLNQRSCDLFGYMMHEGLELTIWDVMSSENHGLIQKWIEARLEGKKLSLDRQTSTAVRKDGSTFLVEISASLVTFNGEPAFQGVLRDVTHEKRLEQQLLQSQKMEAIGTLAGGIAHDFNNALQGILGYTQILLLNMSKDNPEVSKLRQVEEAALRASELTQQLLTFSRKVESRLRPVDLNLEVRQAEKLLRRTIPRMIDIELHLESDLNIINADASQIGQVMMNLGINARDAMPGGGKLTIVTENMVLDEEYCRTHLGAVPGDYVKLSISDSGMGMDKDVLEHIFEPFYTTKDPGKGSGLGLAMVYGIVKNHGGNITCHSEQGQGTTFRIYFPVVEEARLRPSEHPEKAEIRGGTETILLVDDEESIRELAEEILRMFGYAVLAAANGEKALEIYRENKEDISLVILDLIMPGMGGQKCLEEILKADPSQKVVIASGYSTNGSTKNVLKTGAKGYIKKPFEVESMLTVIREVLDRK